MTLTEHEQRLLDQKSGQEMDKENERRRNMDIYAVIWCDFIPLSMHCQNSVHAIQVAKDMHERAEIRGTVLRELRAVRLPGGSDTLETLWRAQEREA